MEHLAGFAVFEECLALFETGPRGTRNLKPVDIGCLEQNQD